MSERDDDIEFDFFDDEPETEEATQRRRVVRPSSGGGGGGGGAPRSRGRPPMRPPADPIKLLRLLGAVAGVIAAIVVLVFVIQGCRERGREDAYRGYMDKVAAIARSSTQVGRDLNKLLTTPGIRQRQLEDGLGKLAQRSEQHVALARELEPPGPLRQQHLDLAEALEFRVIGLNRLRDAFRQTAGSRDTGSSGRLLADQAQRLVTSDVIWDDLFREGATRVMQEEDVTGVAVPDSNFVTNPDLATQRSMVLVFQRTRGATTGGTPGGLHGTNIEAVKATPGGQTLSAQEDNTVTATPDLAFAVTITNGGDFQEVQIGVSVTIQQSPRPIVKRAVIDLIDPGQQKTLVFGNLGQIVTFAQKTTLKVSVEAVPGEARTDNNTAQYSVIFTLVPPS